jgi:hypothetical protein
VPLFRHCRIQRIAPLLEFVVEPRRLRAASAQSPAGQELQEALADAGPLPSKAAALLETRSVLGGVLEVRACSALVKPPSAEVLQAIRRHPRLKGYLEAGAPPGYLLIKAASSPENFLLRCRELGFQIEVR